MDALIATAPGATAAPLCNKDRRAPWQAMLIVLALSLSIRLLWVSFAHVTPLSDFAYYQAVARNLVETGTYGHGDTKAWVPPGYPIFLAGVYAAISDDPLTTGIIHALLGAAASALLVLLGSQFFTTRSAMTGGLLHAAAPTMIAYTPSMATEHLAIPLLLLLLLMTRAAQVRQGRRALLLSLAAGLTGGILLLTRTAALFIIPACLLALLYEPVRRTWSLSKPGLFVLMLSVLVCIWTARNYAVGLGLTPFTTSGGVGLYIANNDACLDGEWGDMPHDFVDGMGEKERAQAYTGRTKEWIKRHPGRYAALCGTRMVRLLGSSPDWWAARLMTPTKDNDLAMVAYLTGNIAGQVPAPELIERARSVEARNLNYLIWQNVLFLSPLGLIALLFAILHWRHTGIIAFSILFYFIGLSLTIASMRYRLMSDPLMFILIGALLSDLFTGSRELGYRPGRTAKIAAALLVMLASLFGHVTGLADRFYALKPMTAAIQPNPGPAPLASSHLRHGSAPGITQRSIFPLQVGVIMHEVTRFDPLSLS